MFLSQLVFRVDFYYKINIVMKIKKNNMKDLLQKLLAIRALTNKNKEYVHIKRTKESDIYCKMVLDLAIGLKEYMAGLENKIKNNELDPEEVNNLQCFLEDLLDFVQTTTFLGGKKNQTWISAGFLLFGIIVYHKALLRILPKTVTLFFLSDLLEKLEEEIYNKIYYSIH